MISCTKFNFCALTIPVLVQSSTKDAILSWYAFSFISRSRSRARSISSCLSPLSSFAVRSNNSFNRSGSFTSSAFHNGCDGTVATDRFFDRFVRLLFAAGNVSKWLSAARSISGIWSAVGICSPTAKASCLSIYACKLLRTSSGRDEERANCDSICISSVERCSCRVTKLAREKLVLLSSWCSIKGVLVFLFLERDFPFVTDWATVSFAVDDIVLNSLVPWTMSLLLECSPPELLGVNVVRKSPIFRAQDCTFVVHVWSLCERHCGLTDDISGSLLSYDNVSHVCSNVTDWHGSVCFSVGRRLPAPTTFDSLYSRHLCFCCSVFTKPEFENKTANSLLHKFIPFDKVYNIFASRVFITVHQW